MNDAPAQILVIDDDKTIRDAWELENNMERLVVLSRGPYIEPPDLSFAGTVLTASAPVSGSTSLKDMERDHILLTLQRCDGHKSETAKVLGIDRKTLREKLKRYNIE